MVEQLRYGGFLKWGYPQSSSSLNHFDRFKKVFFPYKPSIFSVRYLHFMETPPCPWRCGPWLHPWDDPSQDGLQWQRAMLLLAEMLSLRLVTNLVTCPAAALGSVRSARGPGWRWGFCWKRRGWNISVGLNSMISRCPKIWEHPQIIHKIRQF